MRIKTMRIIAALAMMFVGSVASAQVGVGGIGVGAGGAGSVGGGVVGPGVGPGVGGAGSAAGAVGPATGATGAAAGQAGTGTTNAAGNAAGRAGNGAVNGSGAAAGQAGNTGAGAATNAAGQAQRNGVNAAGSAAGQAGSNSVNAATGATGSAAGQVGNRTVNGATNAAGNVTGQTGNGTLNGATNATGAASAAGNAGRSLGVNVREATNGLTITNLNGGSLAQQAGLRMGDRIVSLDGTPIRSHQELVTALQAGTAQTGNLSIVRNGVTQQISLNFANSAMGQAQAGVGQAQQVVAGFRGLNDGITFTQVGNGLQVNQVTNGSWAATSGLMANDRIVALNGIPVTSQTQLMNSLQTAAGQNGTAQMIVNRAGQQRVLQLRIPRESNLGSNASGALNNANAANVNGNFIQGFDRFNGDFRTAINSATGNTRDELNSMNTRLTNLRAEYANIRGQGPQADQFRSQLQTLRTDLNRIGTEATDAQLRNRIQELSGQLNDLKPDFSGDATSSASGAVNASGNTTGNTINAAGNAAGNASGQINGNPIRNNP